MKEFTVSYLWNGKKHSENFMAESEQTACCVFLDELFKSTTSWERLCAKFSIAM